jgi:hypothetical protein
LPDVLGISIPPTYRSNTRVCTGKPSVADPGLI